MVIHTEFCPLQMAIFHSDVAVYQRVNPIKSHETTIFLLFSYQNPMKILWSSYQHPIKPPFSYCFPIKIPLNIIKPPFSYCFPMVFRSTLTRLCRFRTPPVSGWRRTRTPGRVGSRIRPSALWGKAQTPCAVAVDHEIWWFPMKYGFFPWFFPWIMVMFPWNMDFSIKY